MRYRSDLPEPVAASADETMMQGTAIYALLLGVGLCFGGWRGRQYWVVSIGVVLIITGVAYLAGRLIGSW